MEEIFKLQQKIVPELLDLLLKRYNILRTIYYNEPIGRRILASNLLMSERIVRTEIDFLKEQNLIEISTPGMTVTTEGEEVIEKLKGFIHELKGLSEIESIIKDKLKLRDVVVVPGNMEEDDTVIKDMGKATYNYIKNIIRDEFIVALTGGNTIRELIDNIPKMTNLKNILVVPARGGMGKNVEIQANTLAANLAKKLCGNYKLLHIPDNLSNKALDTILNEKEIKDVIDNVKKANILIYGIGRADEMALRRGLETGKIEDLMKLKPVGEAFGCYFDKNGTIVYSTPTVGINNSDLRKIENLIAVAGGKAKAEAIIATEANNTHGVLITDESAALEILRIINH